MQAEPDPDDSVHMDVFDPNDQELQVIQDPVMAFCPRLHKAIEMVQTEGNPTDPANPTFQKNVANYRESNANQGRYYRSIFK
ncbi:hypothetical protein RJ641_017213, partial [Dillenia turbinata]